MVLFRIQYSCVLLLLCSGWLCAADIPVTTRVEITPTPAGADVITFFRNGIPHVCLIRDTLNDSHLGAHRFRQVWDFSYARPTWKQNMAAALPFFYHRAGRNAGSTRAFPVPILDISQPEKGSVGRLAEMLVQADEVDGLGMAFRAPTRAYRGNALDYRNMFLARSLEIVDQGTATEMLPGDLAGEDWDEVRGRLFLATHLLGGFVSNERAEHLAGPLETESSEAREANWDLLRQAAEQAGLYVEPLGAVGGAPREAILWFAQTERGAGKRFDGKFLAIANPWRNDKLRNWKGFTATWHLDRDDAVVSADEGDARAVRMIPLGVYALDYPRVPLLLIDFHSTRAKRREIVRRGATDVVTSVMGWSLWGNLTYFAAKSSYEWYEDRHGAALNRSMRLAAYARLRQLLVDSAGHMDPAFHELLENRLDQIALNPFEQGSAGEAELAKRQYAALQQWAQSPDGLAHVLERDRAAEYYEETHSGKQRAWTDTLHVASLGVWKPYRVGDPEMMANLAEERRLDSAMRLLRRMDAAPEPEVEWDASEIRQAAAEVSELAGNDAAARHLAQRVLGRVKTPEVSTAGSVIAVGGQ